MKILCKKAQFLFETWRCFCLTTPLWNCSINPHCLFPRGKAKIFSNSSVLLIQQRIHVLTWASSHQGASSCSRQQWINSYKWIVAVLCCVVSCKSMQNVRHTRACAQLAKQRWREVNRHALTHSNTFFTSYKSYMSCTLEGLLTFNRFQQKPLRQKMDFKKTACCGFLLHFKR